MKNYITDNPDRSYNDNRTGDAFPAGLCFSPGDASLLLNMGRGLGKKYGMDAAGKFFFRARYADRLRIPDIVEALNEIAGYFFDRSEWMEAVRAFRMALDFDGYSQENGCRLSVVLYNLAIEQRSRAPEAVEKTMISALTLTPGLAEGMAILTDCLRERYELAAALKIVKCALWVSPDSTALSDAMANLLQTMGKSREATGHYRKALQGDPASVCTHINYSHCLLRLGEFEEGWREERWRYQGNNFIMPEFSGSLWEGEDIEGKTLLLWPEKGFGDTIMFCRYAPLLSQRGADVILAAQKPLKKLLGTLKGSVRIISDDNEWKRHRFDYWCPMMSIPGAYGTTFEDIPSETPYLSPPIPELTAYFAARMKRAEGLKIGICARGRVDRLAYRSPGAEYFKPLLSVPGTTFVNLQKEEASLHLGDDRERFFHYAPKLGAFAVTASLIRNLDLVVTCDTSVAHLAGALGCPVWLALSYFPDWRWMEREKTSPWYPGMRLFRQDKPGNWDCVFENIRRKLAVLAEKRFD